MIRYLLLDFAIPAGSVLVILLAVLRFFGEKIFGHVLDQRLQKEKEGHEVALTTLKHEQDAQIEDLRAKKIGHLTDQGKHSNEREYADLSTIWQKLVDLHHATRVCVIAPMLYPPLNSMVKADLTEFIDTTELT
jgi:FMN-dependent NADH-azoreductase